MEGDIKACFDEISHPALMDRVRARIGDKRVLALVKAFLKAGILGEDRVLRDTNAGTPQGSILSPLLSNVALSVLDEHIAQAPGGPATSTARRAKRRRHGLPNYRLVRYADDWCLMVTGTEADAEALREEIAGVLSTMGLRLSPEKTLITHIDEGLDFLGWRIQRHRKRGTNRHYVYTYPAKKARQGRHGARSRRCAGRSNTNQPLDVLLRQLNPMLRGWCAYFRPGVSSATFAYLSHYTVADGHGVAATQTPPDHLEGTPPPLLRRQVVASRPEQGDCSTRRRCAPRATATGDRPSPHPGRPPDEEHHARAERGLWRARCIERCTPGSGSGPGKRTGRKAGHRAPGRLHRPATATLVTFIDEHKAPCSASSRSAAC